MAEPKDKTLARALREGLAQIRKSDYQAELRAAGAQPAHALVVAFDGWEALSGTVPDQSIPASFFSSSSVGMYQSGESRLRNSWSIHWDRFNSSE